VSTLRRYLWARRVMRMAALVFVPLNLFCVADPHNHSWALNAAAALYLAVSWWNLERDLKVRIAAERAHAPLH